MNSAPALHTVGHIARLLNQPLHRVEYFCRSCGLQPAYRAGRFRVFSPEQVEFLRAELQRAADDASRDRL